MFVNSCNYSEKNYLTSEYASSFINFIYFKRNCNYLKKKYNFDLDLDLVLVLKQIINQVKFEKIILNLCSVKISRTFHTLNAYRGEISEGN